MYSSWIYIYIYISIIDFEMQAQTFASFSKRSLRGISILRKPLSSSEEESFQERAGRIQA